MTGLITVEDYNSAVMTFKDSFFYAIDGNIVNELLEDNDEFYYDFIRIKKGSSKVEVYVESPFWTGGIFAEGINELDIDYHYNWPGVELVFPEDSKLYLEMLPQNDGTIDYRWVMNDIRLMSNVFFKNIPKKFVFDMTPSLHVYDEWYFLYLMVSQGEDIELNDFDIDTSGGKHIVTFEYDGTAQLNGTFRLWYHNRERANWFVFNELKNPNFLHITSDLTIGKADNTITIEPFIPGTEEEPVPCTIRYLGKETTFNLSSTQDITIDLSEKTTLTDLKIEVEISEGPNSNHETLVYSLPVHYKNITTYSSLASELGNINGSRIINLTSNIAKGNNDDNIIIKHDTIIYADNHTINLNEGNITINDGVMVKFYDASFIEGDNAIIQKENSDLSLYNCSFTDCTSTNNEGLGSCIYCDIDLSSLTIPNDFKTNIQGTSFTDSHGAILHGGELLVEDCTFKVNSSEIMNTHSPYFLYQTDGDANIRRSIFDVDLTNDNYFCTNEKNANLAQCLFVCGEDAIINGLSSKELENRVNFFGEYNNRSHIFMKYYYPEIESCVYISPAQHYEDHSICYSISDVDFVFRENVQITRADSGNENTTNPLRGVI